MFRLICLCIGYCIGCEACHQNNGVCVRFLGAIWQGYMALSGRFWGTITRSI